MSTKKVTGVDDLGDVMKFWELKNEIHYELQYCVPALSVVFGDRRADEAINLINKIESLGKKEVSNE